LLLGTLDFIALVVAAFCVVGMGGVLAAGLWLCTPAAEPIRRRILRIVGDLI
jgi:hypothetical protein